MAWLDALGDQIVATRSPVESGVLAPEVWHLWVGREAPMDKAAVVAALHEAAAADVIIIRYPSSQAWVGGTLMQSGRALIPAGTILYWGRSEPIDLPASTGGNGQIRPLGVGNEARCRAIITETFAGYTNHYSANPLLARISIADAYADWTSRSLADPDCEVLEWTGSNGATAGMALTRRTEDQVEILLAGMLPASRGRGGYSAFLAAVVNRALRAGAASAVISTQDHNVPVQRLWCRAGFEPVLGITIVHAVNALEADALPLVVA